MEQKQKQNLMLKKFWLWFLDFIETIVIALAIFCSSLSIPIPASSGKRQLHV
ncbi:hypothetical protein ACFL18_01965 [Patescibacteria group bacterium]